jgi:ParB family chromosome partitioning protein
LLAVSDPDGAADRVVAQGMTVRDVERMSEHAGKTQRTAVRESSASALDPDTRALEEKLSLALGAKVAIRRKGTAGSINIVYRNLEQLDSFCQRLSRPPL